ncbi:selenide, water dikinase SelD [Haliscomenobacter hydrossis]|uniref:Selenide, water dikinase n=1 Tax=Haliscomenobacter hydrossis (strain ATCC 27775 / DSM 1100 / LMG 10767 / O) TaxID=760192 RepID=F4KW00_HALH1|nr:selenide, water dikinase SelD [Haliscomenobacter hydrossis]AEE48198.1 Selenide, water dikinase [Haliscomenobacter hydrossis DSM 1100]
MHNNYKLTQYSHGAGCGCKISPSVLDNILVQASEKVHFNTLLVGNDERDDAAVMDLGDGTAIISTTDFFMPIVDDAMDFGQIASVNAISDVYAMGGTPLLAIAILGWPINTLPPEVANLVIEGSRKACLEAGIPLAGGHSIDSPEPIFGLAVTGRVKLEHLKRNGGASVGSKLFLTKPLGVGILTTAQKKGLLREEHANLARNSMLKLNKAGAAFATLPYVEAMTDVTGFGLMGHLIEMCEASGTSAVIELDKIPLLDAEAIDYYLYHRCVPGGTNRNFDSYGHKLAPLTDVQRNILCDPQTSGGLLVAIEASQEKTFQSFASELGLALAPIGEIVREGEKRVEVRN